MRVTAWLGAMVAVLCAAAITAWVVVLNDAPPARTAVRYTPPAVRYTPPAVEVADGVDIDQAEVAAYVERIVNDPRGWRTDLDQFTLRVVEPGYRGVNGIGQLIGATFHDEKLAVVTADAWVRVGPRFAEVGGTLDDQRTDVVLHEMGHLLGHDHTKCPGSGPAPIMRTATYELGDCDLNVWPHP